MAQDFIPYEEALALKELGYDTHLALGWYVKVHIDNPFTMDKDMVYCRPSLYLVAPLWQQAFKFFREKHALDVEIMRNPIHNTLYGKTYDWVITRSNEKEYGTNDEFFHYELAELDCLRKLIELVKDK